MPELQAEPLITELGVGLGMPGLKLDADGSCQLVFDQRWVLTLLADGRHQRFLLNCPLCSPQQLDHLPTSILRALLENNFVGRGFGSAQCSVSIAPDRRVYLQHGLPFQDAADGGLSRALEMLLNQAEAWLTRFNHSSMDETDVETHNTRPATVSSWAFQRV